MASQREMARSYWFWLWLFNTYHTDGKTITVEFDWPQGGGPGEDSIPIEFFEIEDAKEAKEKYRAYIAAKRAEEDEERKKKHEEEERRQLATLKEKYENEER